MRFLIDPKNGRSPVAGIKGNCPWDCSIYCHWKGGGVGGGCRGEVYYFN